LAARIGSVDIGTAAVTLGVAATGFVGGYFSARWQAGAAREQWRRERLLEFCADLVAAGRELVGLHWETKERRYPIEAVHRLDHAVACVLLLGGTDLDDPAFAYQSAVLDAINAQFAPDSDPQRVQATLKSATDCQATFLWLAHNLLLGTTTKPSRWSRLRRVGRSEDDTNRSRATPSVTSVGGDTPGGTTPPP
jgi:hypothetical protein